MPTKKKTTKTKQRPAPTAGVATSVTGLRFQLVDPATLDDNPANWREHPQAQMSALGAVLDDDEIGWAGALLFNERTGRLIDGHARKKQWMESHPGQPAPVLIGSWSEEAEAKILQSLDPIGAMAQANAQKLDELRAAHPLTGEAFAGLRDQLDQVQKDAQAWLDRERQNAAGEFPTRLAAGGGVVQDHYKIVITCKDEAHQTELLDRFDTEGLDCKALVG